MKQLVSMLLKDKELASKIKVTMLQVIKSDEFREELKQELMVQAREEIWEMLRDDPEVFDSITESINEEFKKMLIRKLDLEE